MFSVTWYTGRELLAPLFPSVIRIVAMTEASSFAIFYFTKVLAFHVLCWFYTLRWPIFWSGAVTNWYFPLDIETNECLWDIRWPEYIGDLKQHTFAKLLDKLRPNGIIVTGDMLRRHTQNLRDEYRQLDLSSRCVNTEQQKFAGEKLRRLIRRELVAMCERA